MSLTVAIAYRDMGDPDRQRAYECVRKWWMKRHDDVLTVDDGHPDFSRAGSFNRGVEQAGGDVVVLTGSDVIPRLAAVAIAAEAAAEASTTVYPFSRYVELTSAATEAVYDYPRVLDHDPQPSGIHLTMPPGAPAPSLNDALIVPALITDGQSVGPIIVVPREAYLQMGGMDPRFTGWGFEDVAWWHLQVLAAQPLRVVGFDALHLWHQPHPDSWANPDSKLYVENRALAGRYAEAADLEQALTIRQEAP